MTLSPSSSSTLSWASSPCSSLPPSSISLYVALSPLVVPLKGTSSKFLTLLDFANWLDRPYGYDSHEDIDKYGVRVPLLDLGPPELVLYGTSTKARVPHSSYPEPQSYPGYSKPWHDKESAPLMEIPVSEGPPGSEAVGEGDSDADEEEEESVEEGHKLPNHTTCLNIDPVVMFIEYKFYEIKTKISNVCN